MSIKYTTDVTFLQPKIHVFKRCFWDV